MSTRSSQPPSFVQSIDDPDEAAQSQAATGAPPDASGVPSIAAWLGIAGAVIEAASTLFEYSAFTPINLAALPGPNAFVYLLGAAVFYLAAPIIGFAASVSILRGVRPRAMGGVLLGAAGGALAMPLGHFIWTRQVNAIVGPGIWLGLGGGALLLAGGLVAVFRLSDRLRERRGPTMG